MANGARYLLHRDGRCSARLVVPPAVRPHIEGKTELRTPLGADRRAALKLLPSAVADLQLRIRQAEQKAASTGYALPKTAKFRLTVQQMALSHDQSRLVGDEWIRNNHPEFSLILIDPEIAKPYRKGSAGQLKDGKLSALVGRYIGEFLAAGNSSAVVGSPEWRALARALCAAEYEVLERIFERDEGQFDGRPTHPVFEIIFEATEVKQ